MRALLKTKGLRTMARIGIDYESVKQAAIKLLSQGIAPSVQKIRDVLGTGSHTTIATHLKNWREEYQDKELSCLPNSVPQEIMPALEIFWQTAATQAEQHLLAQKKQVNEQIINFEQEKQRLTALHDEMKQRLAEIEHKLSVSQQTHQDLNKKLLLSEAALTEQKNNTAQKLEHFSDRLNRAYAEKDAALERIDNTLKEKSALQHQLQQRAEEHNQNLLTERERQAMAEARWLVMLDESKAEVKQLRSLLKQEQAQRHNDSHDHQDKMLALNTELAENRSQLKTNQEKFAEYLEKIKETQAQNQNLKVRVIYLEDELSKKNRKIAKKVSVKK